MRTPPNPRARRGRLLGGAARRLRWRRRGRNDAAAPAAGGPITVKATDTACEVAKSTLDAGTHVFAITNSGSQGHRVLRVRRRRPGDGRGREHRPGLSRELHVELPAGTYQTACKPGMIGNGIRDALTVSGSAAPLTEDAALAAGHRQLQRYIKSQTEALVMKTSEFVDRGQGRRRGEGQGAVPGRPYLLGADRAGRRDLRRPRPEDRRPGGRLERRAWRSPASTGSRRTSGSAATSPRTARSPTSCWPT